MSRRSLLAGAAVAAGALALGARVPAVARRTPEALDLGPVPLMPRDAWAAGLAPTGPIPAEPDVQFLLVHHSVDPGNGYAGDDVPGILRGFFRFHTSPAKGWPDIAYNFLVDRSGRVWEGRAGSLAGPVAGDATGGNQGHDQLCCFIGNHQDADPTPEAFAAMGRLLGALAGRYGIDLGAGATATFTSRGSNRHPPGTVVTTPTIAGHRDMSRTQCPGDRVVARLAELRRLAAGGAPPQVAAAPAAPAAAPATAAPPGTPASTTAAPSDARGTPAPTASTAGPTAAPPGTSAPAAQPTQLPAGAGRSDVAVGTPPADGADGRVGGPAALAGVAAAAAAAATGAAVRRHRARPPAADPPA